MENKKDIIEVADLLLDIATTLMGAGSHTSRVVKNVSRMASSFGYDIYITIFQKNLTMMVSRANSVDSVTLVRSNKHMALNFRVVAELSELSWHVHDNNLSVADARKEYERVMATPRISKWVVLLLVAVANASFCRLFNGDFVSCMMVGLGTLVGFVVRQELMAREVSHFIVFATSAFVASMIAGLCYIYDLGATPDIAMATSVLYLIPGVPLINSIADILDGHVLVGLSRFINATMLIVSISVGFIASLFSLGVFNL